MVDIFGLVGELVGRECVHAQAGGVSEKLSDFGHGIRVVPSVFLLRASVST